MHVCLGGCMNLSTTNDVVNSITLISVNHVRSVPPIKQGEVKYVVKLG